jgi:hypothetical protein
MILTETASTQAGAIAQIVAGLIALSIGLWYFVHFLRGYPLPQEEMATKGASNGGQ